MRSASESTLNPSRDFRKGWEMVPLRQRTLLDSAEFFLEINVQRGSCHFFQGSFVILKVLEPLVEGLS